MKLPKFTNPFRPKKEKPPATGTGVFRDISDSPFAAQFSSYEPMKFNLELYEILREAIPVLDVAVIKLVRLIGDFEFECENENALKVLNELKDNVRVNYFQKGINSFISQMTDSAICKGMAFGEMIPTDSLTDIYKLKVAKANYFRFTKKNDEMILVQQLPGIVQANVIENLENVYYLSFDNRDGEPEGYSLFYSLPFVGDIFVRIENSIRNTIWRVGDPSFLVTVEGGTDWRAADNAASKLQNDIANVWKSRKTGMVRDVYAGVPGDVKINVRTLGTDKDLIDLEIPIHTVLEQIISRTEFPAFMFGLYKWTSTERMSTHQNDMIVSNIQSYRKRIDPVLYDICNKKLIYSGINGIEFKIVWNPVNLMDESEQARTEYMLSQARAKEYERISKMYFDGLIDEEELRNELTRYDLVSEKFIKQPVSKILFNMNKNIKLARSQKIMEDIFQEM